MTNDNELSLYQAIWDIDFFLQQGYIEEIHKELSMKSIEILKEFYANKR